MRIASYTIAMCLLWASAANAQTLIFREDFKGGVMSPEWQIHCSTGNSVTLRDGSAEISADWNTYAHISRPLGTDNVTVSARIRPSSPTGITWCTSAFLLWGGGNWCQMGVISAPDGGRYYTVETRGGTTSETYLDECDLTTWRYVRIQLGRDCVRYFAGDDGEHWRCVRVIERPTEFPGPPAFLVAGKGYGRGTAPYANPELDNDYHDRGEKVVSAIADIRAERTPPDRVLLTAAERSQLREADLDPVGTVELRGEADPSFERAAKYYPAMRFPREAVGVPEHPDDIGVDYLGRLQLSGDITSAKSPTAWLEIGDPPVPLGSDGRPLERKLVGGCLPIVVVTAKDEHMECEQTMFGWSEGFSPDADLFAYVRLRVRVPKGRACPTAAHLVLGPENKRTSWPLQEHRSDEAETCLRIPFRDPSGASSVASDEFEQTLGETTKFWEDTLRKAARFELPDRRVNDAYKAWIAYSLLNVDKVKGVYELHDGTGFYEQNYGYSAALYCIALDLYGLHKKAELYLDSLLHFQQSDGLYTQNFGLPDQGTLLLALAEHYNLTGDKAWLQRVSKNTLSAVDWIIRQRANTPKAGVTRGLIKFRPYCDYAEPVFDYFGDTYCCIGMEKAAAALEDIGMRSEARPYRAEARRYRNDILASMDAAAVRKAGRTMLPMEPDTQRLLRDNQYTGGEYYGLVASVMLENEFLPVRDKRSYWVTDLMEQKKGLIAGLSRFGPGGVDHAYTYGYLLTQLKRGDARKVLLGFYSMLAYGMTRGTYSGVECTSIVSGANQWTLPHLYSCMQQLRLLRMMLLREEGDSLLIGEAIPRAWLADGKRIEVKDASTRFGNVSFRISSAIKKGRIHIRLSPPDRSPPRRIRIRLRHPSSSPIRSVSVDGREWRRFTGETIELRGIEQPVRLEVVY